MRFWIGALAGIFAAATLLAQEPELPAPNESDLPLEIEPPLLVPPRAPDGSIPDEAGSKAAVSADRAKLEKDLDRARKRAAFGERLFKAGIIAKVEAEQRVLKV